MGTPPEVSRMQQNIIEDLYTQDDDDSMEPPNVRPTIGEVKNVENLVETLDSRNRHNRQRKGKGK
jgi:hypothetical protein